MKTASRPVSVAGIEFDALLTEEKMLDADVPEYTVEEGYAASDSIIRNPLQLSMTLSVTDTPVTWKSRFGDAKDRVNTVCKKLEELYNKGEPVTVITSTDTYKNMAIASISLSKNEKGRYYREIPITFKQIRVTTAKKTTIPASYYRSGQTAAPAGTAPTRVQTVTPTQTTSKKKKKKKKKKEEESHNSVLYNLGEYLGICGNNKRNRPRTTTSTNPTTVRIPRGAMEK